MPWKTFGRTSEGETPQRSKKLQVGLHFSQILKGFGRPEGRLGEPFEVNVCNCALFEGIINCDLFFRAFRGPSDRVAQVRQIAIGFDIGHVAFRVDFWSLGGSVLGSFSIPGRSKRGS